MWEKWNVHTWMYLCRHALQKCICRLGTFLNAFSWRQVGLKQCPNVTVIEVQQTLQHSINNTASLAVLSPSNNNRPSMQALHYSSKRWWHWHSSLEQISFWAWSRSKTGFASDFGLLHNTHLASWCKLCTWISFKVKGWRSRSMSWHIKKKHNSLVGIHCSRWCEAICFHKADQRV